jgi:hypothetical protein
MVMESKYFSVMAISTQQTRWWRNTEKHNATNCGPWKYLLPVSEGEGEG